MGLVIWSGLVFLTVGFARRPRHQTQLLYLGDAPHPEAGACLADLSQAMGECVVVVVAVHFFFTFQAFRPLPLKCVPLKKWPLRLCSIFTSSKTNGSVLCPCLHYYSNSRPRKGVSWGVLTVDYYCGSGWAPSLHVPS